MPLIEGPNGEEIEFPDDMPHEAISAAMRKQFGGPAAVSAQPNIPMIERPSLSEEISNSADFAEKLGNSFMFNYGDEVAATAGAIPNWLTGGRYGKSRAEILKETRERMKRYDVEHPTEATVADVGGKVMGAAAMPASTTARLLGAAPGLLRTTGVAALLGGLGGAADEAGKIEGPISGGEYLDKVGTGALYGGGIGGAFGGGANIAGRVVGPWATRGAQWLSDRGVRLTPGELLGGYAQRAEDAATSAPLLGNMIRGRHREGVESYNRAAWDEALQPMRGQAPVTSQMPRDMPMGHDAQTEARAIFNRRYGTVVSKLVAEVDQPFDAGVRAISGSLPQTIRPQFANAFERHVRANVNAATGQIPGRGLQDSLQGLRREARNLRRNPGNAYDVDLAQGLDDMRDALEASAGRHSRVQDMNAFRRINESYRNYATLRDAGSRLGAEDAVFTPTHVTSAVRSADTSAGKGAFARGEAPMQDIAQHGKNVMSRKVGDSGTAERAALLTALGIGGTSLIPGATLPAMGLAGGLGALYTPTGNRVFQHLATMSPQTRSMLRRAMERAGVRGGTVAAREYNED